MNYKQNKVFFYNKISFTLFIFFVFYSLFFLSSCLTCDKKEYVFEFTGKGSGKLTITFYNLKSAKENGIDVSEKDFTELTSDYIEGNKLAQEYPDAKVRQAKLFEKDGQLCGKVIVYFDQIEQVKLFQHEGKGPFMLYINNVAEYYQSSNGNYGGKDMPVVFWDKNQKILKLTTIYEQSNEASVSLLDKFRNWKK